LVKISISSLIYPAVIFDDFRNIELDRKVDMVFADPPFGISFKANLNTYNRSPDAISYVEIPREQYPYFINSLLSWSYNILKDTGSMWLVSGWNNLKDVLNAIDKAGFYTLNHCIWKYQFGVFTRKRFVTSHYHLLLLIKNKHRYVFNKPEHYAEDVWIINREYHHGAKTAGNELPIKLVEKCVYTSSNRGDIVLDPVLGSGTTLLACKNLHRKGIGIEINRSLEERIREKVGGINIWI
jgi:site-specific DNA-methyltransferase (adenine-specific)